MRNLLFVFISIAVLASSCKKDDNTPVKKVQSMVYSSGTFYSYEYNADGNVSKIVGSSYTANYTYFGSVIHILNSYQSSSSSANSTVLSLNKKGYVDSVSNGTGSLTTYEYDNSGYVTKMTTLDQSSSYSTITTYATYVYENGNLKTKNYSSIYYYSANSSTTSSYTINYEYYTDKANTILSGTNFWGKSNKNLTKKETKTYTYTSSPIFSSSSDYTSVTNYTYEYQDGYATKKNITTITTPNTGSSTTATSWISYTYK